MATSELDEAALAEIEKRANAATPGPWHSCLGSGEHQCTGIGHDDPEAMTFTLVADCLPDYALKGGIAPADHIPNLKFIEAAREDVLALCTALRAARQRIAEVEAEIPAWAAYEKTEGWHRDGLLAIGNALNAKDARIAELEGERDALQRTVDGWAGIVAAHQVPSVRPAATLTVAPQLTRGRCPDCGTEVMEDRVNNLRWIGLGGALHICKSTLATPAAREGE